VIERLVVINDLSVASGGASALAIESAKQFQALGYPTTFISGDSGANDDLLALGIEIKALGAGRLLDRGAWAAVSGLYNRPAFQMVRRWIAENDTPGTVYHLHGWSQILSPSVMDALQPVRRRLTISAHDFFLVCPNGSYSFFSTGHRCELTPMSVACMSANCDRRSYAQKVWRVARQALCRLFMRPREYPNILLIHEDMSAAFIRSGVPQSRLVTVRNPVTPYTSERIAAEHNRTFVFIGRLEETKGADLAAAAARLAGVHMCFIGDGALRATLQKRYPEMTFTGHQHRGNIGRLLGDARALVMPSRYPEPFGLVAVEALWSGLPVISGRTAFLTRDIEAAGAGRGCDPRDEAAFADLLREVANDDALCRKMSENAFSNTASIAMSPEDWTKSLLCVYRDILSQTKTSAVGPTGAAA
jgi:glycosyltransferase involved in cell wall biosynthesis